MREIKFRAWNKMHKKMDGPITIPDRLMGGVRFGFYGEKDNWIWMQFTGLHDKTGKEVDWWEDDLIKAANGIVGVIKYIPEFGSYWIVCNDTPLCSMAAAFHDSWQKIGNIHESPELLEGS